MQKKYFFWVIFFPPRKKGHFRAIFRGGQRSVAEPGPTPSPWSIVIKCDAGLKRVFLDVRKHFLIFSSCSFDAFELWAFQQHKGISCLNSNNVSVCIKVFNKDQEFIIWPIKLPQRCKASVIGSNGYLFSIKRIFCFFAFALFAL